MIFWVIVKKTLMKKCEKMLDAKLERDMAGPHALLHKAFAFIYK